MKLESSRKIKAEGNLFLRLCKINKYQLKLFTSFLHSLKSRKILALQVKYFYNSVNNKLNLILKAFAFKTKKLQWCKSLIIKNHLILNIYTGTNLKKAHSEVAVTTKWKIEEVVLQQQLEEQIIETNLLAHQTLQT